jgi:hypothetical protein
MPLNTVMENIRKLEYGIVAEDNPNKMTRYSGSHVRKNHPYVSGYWYLVINVPQIIFGDRTVNTQIWLHSVCESFTPPTKTIRKEDIPGLGGVGASFITGQDITRTFTITFKEYQHLPIKKIFDMWTGVMDHHHGLSPLAGKNWVPRSYKGNCFVILAKPTGYNAFRNGKEGMGAIGLEDIEDVYFFEGVFPETDPNDGFNSDISSTSFVTHSINFSFDGFPLNSEIPGVAAAALESLDSAIESGVFHDMTQIGNVKNVVSADESKTERYITS